MTARMHAQLGRIAGQLEALDLSPAELVEVLERHGLAGGGDGGRQAAVPTVAEYLPTAAAAHRGNTARTYRTYWKVLAFGVRLPSRWDAERVDGYLGDARAVNAEKDLGLAVPASSQACRHDGDGQWVVADGLADRRLDRVGESDVRVLGKWVLLHTCAKAAGDDRARQAAGLPGRAQDGKGAQRHFVDAVRSLYSLAAGDGLVGEDTSPARRISRPKVGAAEPKAMSAAQLADVWTTCATTGDDPDLDALLARFHFDTGARQEAAINLKLTHLDFDQQLIWLDSKHDKRHRVPVTVELLEDLLVFACARGSQAPSDPVLRQKGRHRYTDEPHPPLTPRRYNTVSKRVREQHPWARQAWWQPYWLRHHAGAEMEDLGGPAVKRRFLGHEPEGVTDRYGVAALEHVAWAVAMRTGRPHPLAQRPPWL